MVPVGRVSTTRNDAGPATALAMEKALAHQETDRLTHGVSSNAKMEVLTREVLDQVPTGRNIQAYAQLVSGVTLKLTGLPTSRVLGSGTVLDSSRFRYLIAARCNVAVQNVHAYIVGEHGDSEIPLWSSASVGTIDLSGFALPGRAPLDQETKRQIARDVVTAAEQIIRGKGATNYAIGLATTRIRLLTPRSPPRC